MKLSLSTGCLYLYPLKVAFAWARELGFQGVEVALPPEVLVRGTRLVRELSQSYELPVLSLHPPLLAFPGWGSPLKRLSRLIEMAEEMGSPMVVLHARGFTNLAEPRAQEFLAALAAHRGESRRGPEVVLETPGIFFPRDERYYLHSPPRLARFAAEQGLRLALDTSHLGTTSLGLMGGYRLLSGNLANVHFSDLARPPKPLDTPSLHSYIVHHQLPGAGTLPLADFLRALRNDGYSGPLTLEFSPVALRFWHPALAKRRLRQALEFVRGVLAGS